MRYALLLAMVSTLAYADTAQLVSQRTATQNGQTVTVCIYRSPSGATYQIVLPPGGYCQPFIDAP